MGLRMSSAPHIRTSANTQTLMRNVLISLLPCVIAGVIYYEMDAVSLLSICVASAVAAEYVWQLIFRLPVRVGDYSAAVTGLILGLTLPPTIPWWGCVIGSVFAIIVVKQLFGGIGDNFLNPALTARAVLLASWPARMTTYIDIAKDDVLHAATMATPLSDARANAFSNYDLFMGGIPGSVGETCKWAILIGLAYLLITKTISWRIPVVTVASTFVMSYLLGYDPVMAVISGGILFGAVYMATDYTTSPMVPTAQYAYAIGIGVLTVVIRKYGAYPEGVTYAILIMNILTPLLDKYMPNKVYGHSRKREATK